MGKIDWKPENPSAMSLLIIVQDMQLVFANIGSTNRPGLERAELPPFPGRSQETQTYLCIPASILNQRNDVKLLQGHNHPPFPLGA